MAAPSQAVGLARLQGLPQALAWLRACGVRGLASDSRRLQPGEAFIAWPGAARDPRAHLADAFAAGAAAALVEAEGLDAWLPHWPPALQARCAALPGLKALAGPLAADALGQPGAALQVLAVTGTNGKTSSTWWMAQALEALGRPAGVVGTLGAGRVGQALRPTGFTTPDPVQLQASLRGMADAGLQAVAVEASSIGLAEHRLEGLPVTVAVYTQLGRDHLDYHGSLAAYAAAKRRLFATPGLQAAVLNADDPEAADLAATLAAQPGGPAVWTHSARGQAGARLRAEDRRLAPEGLAFTVVERGEDGRRQACPLATRLFGDFHVENLLGVVGALRALGHALPDVVAACAGLSPVPGRLQRVEGPAGGPAVLVDYAHTPEALAGVLASLRPLARARGGRLHVLVGCGGERDRGKRPAMAAAAEAGADRLVLSSDNPRGEDPRAILADMQAGLARPQAATVEPDRRRAIAAALAACAPDDVLLLAGKGHETTQEIAGVHHPFDDVAEAAAALAAWTGGEGAA